VLEELAAFGVPPSAQLVLSEPRVVGAIPDHDATAAALLRHLADVAPFNGPNASRTSGARASVRVTVPLVPGNPVYADSTPIQPQNGERLRTHQPGGRSFELAAYLAAGNRFLVTGHFIRTGNFQLDLGPVLVDPDDVASLQDVIHEVDRIFIESHCDPLARWEMKVWRTKEAPDPPWVANAGMAQLRSHLERLASSRGGVVAIADPREPLRVVQLAAKRRRDGLRVTGTVIELAGSVAPSRLPERWLLDDRPGSAENLLAGVRGALGRGGPGDGDDVGLSIRLEQVAAAEARGGSVEGCLLASLIAGVLWVACMGLFALGWREVPLLADLARVPAKDELNTVLVASIAVGFVLFSAVLPALLAHFVASRVLERRHLSYRLEARLKDAITIAAYLAWTAAVFLVPAWPILVGGLTVGTLAFVGAVLLLAVVRQRRAG
jgi:hypothetical protein